MIVDARPTATNTDHTATKIRRRPILGGLTSEYTRAARPGPGSRAPQARTGATALPGTGHGATSHYDQTPAIQRLKRPFGTRRERGRRMRLWGLRAAADGAPATGTWSVHTRGCLANDRESANRRPIFRYPYGPYRPIACFGYRTGRAQRAHSVGPCRRRCSAAGSNRMSARGGRRQHLPWENGRLSLTERRDQPF